MIKALIRYQEVDGKLLAIEKEIASSEERKKYMTARKFLEKAPEKLEALDLKATELVHLLELLAKKYDEIVETVKEYENLDEMVEQGADVSFYKKNATQIIDSLKTLKADINKLATRIEEAKAENATAKKQTIAAQKQNKEYKVKYSEVKDARAQEIKEIENELGEIAKNIPADLLAKYNTKRKEKLFPVACSVKGNRCPQCGMELSIAEVSKLSDGNIIDCDNCHRILFTEK